MPLKVYCDASFPELYRDLMNICSISTVVIDDNNNIVYKNAKIVKCDSKSDFEYRGILYGLSVVVTVLKDAIFTFKHSDNCIIIFNDSHSIIQHINNNFQNLFSNIVSDKIKNKILYNKNFLTNEYNQNVIFEWIPRENNNYADELASNKLKKHLLTEAQTIEYLLYDIKNLKDKSKRNLLKIDKQTSQYKKIKYFYEQINTLYNYLQY